MNIQAQIDFYVNYIKQNQQYIQTNKTIFDIYEGNLLPYVKDVLKKTLSPQYYDKIEERIIPINILKRLIDKMAKVYATSPIRTATTQQEMLDEYEKTYAMNRRMNLADEYANMFKGYALEPFIDKGKPKLRTIPLDRFLVGSLDPIDPLEKTFFIKFMGARSVEKDGQMKEEQIYYAYTNEHFIPFTEGGEVYLSALSDNEIEDFVNPVGFIPFMYGNRSNTKILPTQDSDLLALTKMIPVFLSDLGGAIMFQCFSIIYGVDVDSENLLMSPNAFWSFESDKSSDKNPQIGTISPEAKVDDVLKFIETTFAFWLETKGIKVGSLGSMSGANMASGISKIIDEMDTFEIRKVSMESFKEEETLFWNLNAKMHNFWVESGQLKGATTFKDNFEVTVVFDEPKAIISRKEEVETVKLEDDSGYLDRESAIKILYPDLSESEVAERISKIETSKGFVIDGQATEKDNNVAEKAET